MRSLALPGILAFSIILGSSAQAQVRQDWTRTYADPVFPMDQATAVATDAAGRVYAAGTSSPSAGSTGTLFLASWGADGLPLWSATYDGPQGGIERAYAVALDGAGSLYVVGTAWSPTLTRSRAILLKITTGGAPVWTREFGRALGRASARCLAIDAQGRILVGGRAGQNNGDFSVAAFHPNGLLLWEATYDGAAGFGDAVGALALAPNGDVVAGGGVGVLNGSVPAVLRVDPSGQIVWAREYQPAPSPYGVVRALAVDSADRIFLGLTMGQFSNDQRMAAAAFDAGGNELWFHLIPGTLPHEHSGTTAVAIDPFGRALVAGTAWTTPTSYGDFVAVAFDAAGQIAWSRSLDNPGGVSDVHIWDRLATLSIDPAGNPWLVGTSGRYLNAADYDVVAVGLDTQGEVRFTTTYNAPPVGGSSWDAANAAAFSPPDGLVIVGQAQEGVGPYAVDALVLRLTRTATAFCAGDGSSAACPCGNESAPIEGAGCANALGTGGKLVDEGASSLANDTFVLLGTGMPDGNALFVQGTVSTGSPVPFGDGLRCVGGSIVRLGVHPSSGGGSQFPAAGDPTISIRGSVAAPGTRVYQVLYRDPTGACAGSAFNWTNGLRVIWTL